MLYLDNNATTSILPEVKDAMLPYLLEEYGNPSSKYYSLASNAKNAVEDARINIATLLKCLPEEIIFTSGATESNNMIIKGLADYYGDSKGNCIITSKVEHAAIIETCKYLETKGFNVTYLDVDQYGRIDIKQLKKIIVSTHPLLVSIMWGNNELGSLNPAEKIASICYENNVFFHTDGTQVIGKCPISLVDHPGIQFLSGSAHKIHGPKGIGVAIIRKDKLGLSVKLTPLIHGGGQEYGYRSGTLAVHDIVGFGKAAEIAQRTLIENNHKLQLLERTLTNILTAKFGNNIIFNNDTINKVPGVLSVQFKGINNEVLVRKLSKYIALSTGSACSSSKPSHVLSAIGLSVEQIRETVRFSLSSNIDPKELDIFKSL